MRDSKDLLNDLVHMLSHLRDLEEHMEREINQAATAHALERLSQAGQVQGK